MTQGGNGQMPIHNNDPYQGTGRVFLHNTTTPDKVFGSSMPNVTPDSQDQGYTANRIYGNEYYSNPHLQGYSQTGQNIINIDQLTNGVTQMTPEMIEQLRRNGTKTPNYPNQPVNQYPNQSYNYNPAPGVSNQMYMQAPAIPPIQSAQLPIPDTPQTSQVNQPAPDLSTAEGTIDYLNSIAPQNTDTGPKLLSNKMFVILGASAIALVLVMAIIGALGNTGGGFSKASRQVGQSIADVQSILDYGESNSRYTSTSMTNVIAESQLVLSSHQLSLGEEMTLGTVDDKGEESEATADEEIVKELDDAIASGNLGVVYGQELYDRLSTLADDIQTAYNATKKKDARDALDRAYTDVVVLMNRIDINQSSTGGQAAD